MALRRKCVAARSEKRSTWRSGASKPKVAAAGEAAAFGSAPPSGVFPHAAPHVMTAASTAASAARARHGALVRSARFMLRPCSNRTPSKIEPEAEADAARRFQLQSLAEAGISGSLERLTVLVQRHRLAAQKGIELIEIREATLEGGSPGVPFVTVER